MRALEEELEQLRPSHSSPIRQKSPSSEVDASGQAPLTFDAGRTPLTFGDEPAGEGQGARVLALEAEVPPPPQIS